MAEPFIYFDDGPDGAGVNFRAPRRLIMAETAAAVADALADLDQARADGYWVAGYASYELGYALMEGLGALMPAARDTPLMLFGVFDGPAPAPSPVILPKGAGLTPPIPVWDRNTYRAVFEDLRAYIAAGDVYQVNLSFAMAAKASGTPEALFSALAARQPVAHGALVDLGAGPVILSRSPELFFRTTATGLIETLPMKGTIARGLSAAEDVARCDWLARDPKNRAENLMIVDLLRNDISRVSEVGSVKVPELFSVQSFATVHQMVSRVTARLLPGVGLAELLRALFPCGSITGAPKHRAMQIIRELEVSARGVYCGAIGWMAPDGASSFNVAIRTLSLFEDGRVRLNVGGGVVWDSTAPSEYEEALWKARYVDLI